MRRLSVADSTYTQTFLLDSTPATVIMPVDIDGETTSDEVALLTNDDATAGGGEARINDADVAGTAPEAVNAEPTDGPSEAPADAEVWEDFPDLARDVDDPLPAERPVRRHGTEDGDGVDRDEAYFGEAGTTVSAADRAVMAGKLGTMPSPSISVSGLNLSRADRRALQAGGVVRTHAPLDRVVWSSLALGRQDRVPASLVEQRAGEQAAMGQVKPCRARLLEDGTVELLTGMVEWLAAKHAADASELIGTIVIDLEQLDDAAARKVVFADAAEGVKVAPVDLARWATDAIVTYGTQRKLAKALGIDESNVTRLLHVGEAVDILAEVITDEWAVSRAQAAAFIALWNDRGRRPEIKRFLSTLPQGSAAKTFRAIQDRFGETPPKRPGEVSTLR